MIQRTLILAALTSPALLAQDGGQLYTTYCSACHGTSGEGAQNGQFPPLGGSPWPVGNPERAIKIVLNGLHGEVNVNGRTWNLEMPPQGAVLPDDQIAAILTYVRSSWGNKADAVDTAKVKEVRAAVGKRSEPWTAAELLKQYPIDQKPPIADLLSYYYEGDWPSIPDFTTLKAKAVEEEHRGYISLTKIARKDDFGVVWEGNLELPEDAEYEFKLDADDGARLILDGQKLAEITGIGPLQGRGKKAFATFTKGPHKIRVEYHEAKGGQEIELGWRKKGTESWTWLTDHQIANKKWPDIPIVPIAGRPAIYRNFIQGTSPRAIGIGFPAGVNFAWSADHLGPELLWTGKFMDGGHHWTERGQGFEPPAGERVVILSTDNTLPQGAKFRGYKFDAKGGITFASEIGKLKLLDTYAAGTSAGNPAIVRTLAVSGEGAPVELLISDKPLKPTANGEFEVNQSLLLSVTNGDTPKTKDGKSVLTLTPGQTITFNYHWK